MDYLLQRAKRVACRFFQSGENGQALVEFTVVAVTLISLSFAVIDFSRAIYLRQVLINLSRETANLEARGSGTNTLDIMQNALDATVTSALPLSLNSANGLLIVTAVTNFNRGYIVAEQLHTGSLFTLSASHVGKSGVGGAATLPLTTGSILPPNHTVYVAEIFYKFKAITPVGHFFKGSGLLPTNMYDVAYFSAL